MTYQNKLARGIAFVLAAGYSSLNMAAPPSSSAYFTDLQFSHVEDATSEGIGTVNMIACIMSAMKPDVLVNKGNYIALVDENKCDSQKRSGTDNSSGDGSQGATYTTAIVNSSRASNSDPMISKIWLNEVQDDNPMTIYVHTSATQAPTTSNPYGVFRLDFCGRPDGAASCMMKGFLDAQAGSLSFFQSENRDDNGVSGTSTTALQLTSVGTTTGSGKLSITKTQGTASTNEVFAFAYDQGLFLRGDQCFSRDASDSETRFSVWRYGLYDATTGDRITRNSGFPIDYVSGGTTYHGYIGYSGLSLPSDAGVLANGATVQKVDYSAGSAPTTTAYSVVRASGKLTKYTRKSTTLDKLDKIKLSAFVGNNVAGFITGAVPNTQYEMYWDNTAGNFKVTGQMNCSQSGCQTQDVSPEQPVAASFFVPQGGVQGFSQSLGGEVFVDLHGLTGAIVSTSVTVSYRVQDIVYPADMPAQLYCINNCPTVATMTGYFTQNVGSSPFGTSFNNWNPTLAVNVRSYTGDTTAAVLKDVTAQALVFTDASALQSRPEYQNGVRTGRLFTNLAGAECSTGSNTYCDYKVNDLDVYYQWETGANNWNQFAAIKDSSGNVVKFDAPLQVTYTVPTGAQYGQYAGTSIVLQYGGYGDLWGVPGHCVSHLTNQPASCDSQDSRYVPEFFIPMSDITGVVKSGQTNYLVKWLDREIRFARKNLSVCSALTAPSNVTLPSASGLLDPSDPNSSAYNGVKPTVTTAPRVIHGDVKY